MCPDAKFCPLDGRSCILVGKNGRNFPFGHGLEREVPMIAEFPLVISGWRNRGLDLVACRMSFCLLYYI